MSLKQRIGEALIYGPGRAIRRIASIAHRLGGYAMGAGRLAGAGIMGAGRLARAGIIKRGGLINMARDISGSILGVPGSTWRGTKNAAGAVKDWFGRPSTFAEKIYTGTAMGVAGAAVISAGIPAVTVGGPAGVAAALGTAGGYAVGVPTLAALNKAAYAAMMAPAAMVGVPLMHAATATAKGAFGTAKTVGSFAGKRFLSAQRANFASSKVAAATLTYAGIGIGGYVGLRAAGNLVNNSIKDRYQDNTMGLSQSLHRAYR